VLTHILFTSYAYVSPHFRSSYFLLGFINAESLIIGSLIAAVTGAVGSYFLDLCIGYLEKFQE
jgi:hypothetical protein